jgi:hypothetical protein
VACFSEHGNESLGSMKSKKFLSSLIAISPSRRTLHHGVIFFIFSSVNDIIHNCDYVALNNWVILNNELEGMWKVEVMP